MEFGSNEVERQGWVQIREGWAGQIEKVRHNLVNSEQEVVRGFE